MKFQRAKSPEKLKDYENLLQKYRDDLQQASATHQQNTSRLDQLKGWANPDDQTLLQYHEQLLKDIENAKRGVNPQGNNALNQFNDQANNLGEAQRDLSILRNSKPELFPKPEAEAAVVTSGKAEKAGDGYQAVPSAKNEGVQSTTPHQPWEVGPRTKYIPDNIEDLIDMSDKTRPKLSKDALDSRDKWITSMTDLVNKGLGPDSRLSPLLDRIRKFSDDLWALGYDHNLLKSYVENHIRRDWKDDNVGRTFRTELRNGKFAMNILAARHRYWGTFAEGWARGKDLSVIDPIEMNRIDSVHTAEAIANRKAVRTYIENPHYDSRGMPSFVTPGWGEAVQNPDGRSGDPAYKFIVHPDSLISTEVPEEQLARLEASGQKRRTPPNGGTQRQNSAGHYPDYRFLDRWHEGRCREEAERKPSLN